MTKYTTPGVYVVESSSMPPPIVQVATAVPAFIGSSAAGKTLARVTSMLEFERVFGKGKPTPFVAVVATDKATGQDVLQSIRKKTPGAGPDFLLHYAVRHYFENGGGDCYVVSVGDFSKPPTKADILDGLARLAREDEPTLIVPTDAALLTPSDHMEVAREALSQCAALRNRFAILDVPGGDVYAFRNGIGADNLSYGAAYHPFLETTLTFAYEETGVDIRRSDGERAGGWKGAAMTMADLKATQPALYNSIKDAMDQQRVTLPPSAAVAGVYARTDRERGVWKAPANVGLSAVVGPAETITDAAQSDLSIDPTTGKSINPIRAFNGHGTLVWGARTLDGNERDWRYVPVRRLCMTIEESIRKSTAFAVLMPNDASTWTTVSSMIESFLSDLWRQGAMAGSDRRSAYFVNVGLGTSMTPQDVLEGRLIIDVGIAAMHPAEFLVLRLTHQVRKS